MKKIFNLLTLFLLINLYTTSVKSLTTSAHLVSNAAFHNNDYETASQYYYNDNAIYININELKKRLFAFVNVHNLENAKTIADQIIDLDKYDEDAWLVKLVYAQQGSFKKIFNDFEKLNNIDHFKLVEFIFYEDKKLKNKKNIEESILDIVKSYSSSYSNDINSNEYFLFLINLSLFINPKLTEALYIKGQFYQQFTNYVQAEKIYSQITSSDYLFLESQMNIAIIKNMNNEFKLAVKILQNLIIHYPHHFATEILLADIYRANSFYNKAINLYSKIIKNINNQDELWRLLFMRGICFEKLNNWQKAERDFLKALEIYPNQPKVLNYLAYGWIEKNLNLDRSLRMLEIAVEKDPESYFILDSLAWAHFKKENYLEAMKLMEKVIEMAPGEAISLDHLGDIYFALGRKREAFFMWKQALDLALPEDNIINDVVLKIEKYNAG